MAVDTVYVMAGGAYMAQIFNGVATMVGTSAWDSMMRIVMLISGMSALAVYMRSHDPKELVKFVAFIILITSVLLIPKRSVQIIDRSDPTGVYRVDNVPLGLAVPAKFITSIGTDITEIYERLFHLPDSLMYSKTGMLYGADLVGHVSDVMTVNGDLAELMGMYVKNCVIGDILLNHKYSFQELMNSRDPYTLIFRQPSPLRGVMVPYGNSEAQEEGFWTCEMLAKNVLMPKLGIDTTTGGATWEYTVRRLFGGAPNANVLYATLLGDSYNYYYQGGQTAGQLMRTSVVMNALRNGISAYSAQSGDTASLVNLSSSSSYNKMRLSWATSGSIGVKFLPLMNTILLALIFALFPITILLATIHALTIGMLKNYIFSIIYLQSWPPMFAILNSAATFYLRGKTGGTEFNLANLASIQEMHSDIGLVAGWLTLSIPFIAYGIVKGMGSVVSQAGNYLGTAINSSATASSSQAADGTWAFNNMQTDNVSGNKWDTNYSHREGQTTKQLASGASVTQTASGQMVYDSSTAMSRLPVSIKGSDVTASTLQDMARRADVQASSAQHGYQSSVNSGWNQLSQFSAQTGNSATLSSGTDSGMTANQSQAVAKMQNAVSTVAKNQGISEREAFENLMNNQVSRGYTIGTKVSGGAKIPGVGGVEGYFDANKSDRDSVTKGTQEGGSRNTDYHYGQNVQAQKDFREGWDVLESERISHGTSQNDNTANSDINQFAATLSVSQNSYDQYMTSRTRSQEYSEMASLAKSHSAQIDRNFDQQFVNYVMEKTPGSADRILSDTSSPDVARERDALAKSFAEERIVPQLESEHAANKAKVSEPGISDTGAGSVSADPAISFAENKRKIEKMSDEANIRRDIPDKVAQRQSETEQHIRDNREQVAAGKQALEDQKVVAVTENQVQQVRHTGNFNQARNEQKMNPDAGKDEQPQSYKQPRQYSVPVKKE
ncbi:conjugal transfer mating-pair stabilization protein TraG [Morganella morganii]|uniref:conjugal transfer mating-pair stabilization protein TraG n=2 Tax=Morganella morganii TaxID=582 RepID=UPI00069FFBFD|nr:conjugal transfer mating-pair stabilization protein TraG [Morganella morganii]MBT0358147.1 conjugal transfer mating pair stabilization protein TraG [Morganella morganii subsp. morganii]MIO29901.1 conjugal transfer protein TraG [Salmonella enterica subsp. enterica serovar Mbandaka]